ncbi:type II toxin-antitoxin system VapC family toxin [Mucilaginibacter pedocola]|uniref:PIN domain-containing protein n=1 Tax=Mucilaginibacter pedocola TaxID=1792845 RepID=A0A1S9PEF4_9SPHI|nr:type II toxin-antitoxin system VapC family toxin [Mucilaginibacter pedocola]OOQ59289.1 hypothetical protein BC343_28640 [Mucilaginibacter pedocola]
MGKTFLIDTNVILDYTADVMPIQIARYLEDILDEQGFYISVINRIELLGHISATEDLAIFLDTAIIHHLTEEVVEQTISLRKIKKIKLPDAVIAATAIVHDHILITRNIRDFQNISGLKVIDPYNI